MKINEKLAAILVLSGSLLAAGCSPEISLSENAAAISSRSVYSANEEKAVKVTDMKNGYITFSLSSKKVNYARLYVSMGNGTGLVLANQDMDYSDGRYTYTFSNPTYEEGAEIYYTILVNDGAEYCLPQGSLNSTTSWAKLTYGTEVSSEKKTYSIICRNSGLSLDDQDYSKEEGANVQQWAFNPSSANQLWYIEEEQDGYCKITNVYSGLSLGVAGDSTNDGANVVLQSDAGRNSQRWAMEDLGDGYSRIVNKNSGLVLDVAWASKDNGANVQQCNWNAGDAQRWMITEVSALSSSSASSPSSSESSKDSSSEGSASSTAVSSSKYLNSETLVDRTTGLMTMQFKNNTSGKWSDDEIYITAVALNSSSAWCYLTPDGTLNPISASSSSESWSYTLAQLKNGVQLPAMTSGRMYISMGSPVHLSGVVAADGKIGIAQPDLNNPNDLNQDKYFDWVEFTLSDAGFWGNTTQVDQFCIPIVMAMYDNGGYFKSVGITESRDEIFSEYKAMGGEFATLADSQYRIIAPCKGEFRTGRTYGNYMDDYVNECWDYLLNQKNVLKISHPLGDFTGYTTDDGKLVFHCTATGYGTIAQVGKDYFVNGKPNDNELFEGSGVLASPTPGADGKQTTVELALQAWVCAALNRHVFMDSASWSNPSTWYREGKANYYAAFWHKHNIDGAAYGFCYDDVFDQSSLIQTASPRGLVIGIGW